MNFINRNKPGCGSSDAKHKIDLIPPNVLFLLTMSRLEYSQNVPFEILSGMFRLKYFQLSPRDQTFTSDVRESLYPQKSIKILGFFQDA